MVFPSDAVVGIINIAGTASLGLLLLASALAVGGELFRRGASNLTTRRAAGILLFAAVVCALFAGHRTGASRDAQTAPGLLRSDDAFPRQPVRAV